VTVLDQTRIDAAALSRFGVSVELRDRRGRSLSFSAVLSRMPRPIGDGWEYQQTAQVPVAELAAAPDAGDVWTETASGRRWIVERADEQNGMWTIELRPGGRR
jgi:hypothetical protein